METFYSILGIGQKATPAEIKSAYKKKAMQYHPDKVNNLGDKLKFVAEMESKKLNEAKEVLLDEEKRKEYDKLLNKGIVQPHRGIIKYSDEESSETVTTQVKDFKDNIKTLENMITSLKYEISILSNKLEEEERVRTNLMKKVDLFENDWDWMIETLESVINTYNSQIKYMNEHYRNIVSKTLNDLAMEVQLDEEIFEEVNKRIYEIQWYTSKMFDNVFGPYGNFEDVRTKLKLIKTGVSLQPTATNDTTYYSEGQKGNVGSNEKIECHTSKSNIILNSCPFCGKEIESDQTYCFYCGAVF